MESTEVEVTATSAPPSLKRPKSKKERDALREGFTEDDNSDIGYLNFELFWPCLLSSVISYVFIGITAYTLDDWTTASEYTYPYAFYVKWFGKVVEECNNTRVFEPNMRPSILRQVEMQVLTNVCFRIAMLLPLAVRMFQTFTINRILADRVENNRLFDLLNNIVVPVTAVELLASALFSIITIRFDFPEFHRVCIIVFGFAAGLHMAVLCTVSVWAKTYADDILSKLSLAVKILSFIAFCITAPHFLMFHQTFISSWGCHGYVPEMEAFTEYLMFIAYLCFHSSKLIDIRAVQFICYPRTCSGECEPVVPANFKKGGKFEHCRSYEHRHRQVVGL